MPKINAHREKMKQKGYETKSYQLSQEALETLKEIKNHTGDTLSSIVDQAIIEYGKRHHQKATQAVTTVSSAEFNRLQSKCRELEANLNFLTTDYLIVVHDWEPDQILKMRSYLEGFGKSYEELRTDEIFNQCKEEGPYELTSKKMFFLFLDRYFRDPQPAN